MVVVVVVVVVLSLGWMFSDILYRGAEGESSKASVLVLFGITVVVEEAVGVT